LLEGVDFKGIKGFVRDAESRAFAEKGSISVSILKVGGGRKMYKVTGANA
jgi:hypothetical protein